MNWERTVIYEGPIAGITYGHYKFRPDRLKNRALAIVPDPANEYDSKAIALKVINGTAAYHVGFIPRRQTYRLHEVLERKGRLEAQVTRTNLLASVTDVATLTVWELTKPKVRGGKLNPVGTRRLILS